MSKDIRRGDADGQHIGHVVVTHLFARNQRLRKVEEIGDRGGRFADVFIKTAGFRSCLTQGLVGPVAVIEGLRPLRQLLLPIGRRNEPSAGMI